MYGDPVMSDPKPTDDVFQPRAVPGGASRPNLLLAKVLDVDVADVPEGVVIVAFGAKWCVPWRLLQKRLEDISARGLHVAIVDVDDFPSIADQWGVVALPTVVLIEGCQEKRRWVGAVGAGELAATESGTGIKTGMRRRR